jgi:hypothetical protein
MVSIIIINFHQKDLLCKCIDSIYSTITSYPYETIIINNSADEDIGYLSNRYNNLKVIENLNEGFSQANNSGARQSDGNFLFFLNADTIIKNDFLKNSVEIFNDENVGVVGLKLCNEDNTFQLSFWKENTFFNEIKNKKAEAAFKQRNLNVINKFESAYKNISAIDWVSGAAMLMRKETFNKIGGFDEDYFLFYEDADICQRLKKAGYKIIFYPYSSIVHLKGENINEQFKTTTYLYSKRSQLIYYKKHNGLINRTLLRTYLILKFLLLSLFTFKKINFRILVLVLGLRYAK